MKTMGLVRTCHGSILSHPVTTCIGLTFGGDFWGWLIDDLVYEGDEAFKLRISLVDPPSQPNVVIGKQDTLVVVINDNDPVF